MSNGAALCRGALLSAWGLGSDVSAESVELSRKGYPVGRVRLVEYAPPATQLVRHDVGDQAIDDPAAVGPKTFNFYVETPMEPNAERLIAAGCRQTTAVVKYQVFPGTLTQECQFVTADGALLMLIGWHEKSICAAPPNSENGPFSEIPTASVITSDPDKTRESYENILGLTQAMDMVAPDQFRDPINEVMSVSKGTPCAHADVCGRQ